MNKSTNTSSSTHPCQHWTSEQLSEALGVSINERFTASGVSIDSRTLNPGDVFVALKGEDDSAADGHDYAQEALDRGAVAVIAHKAIPGLEDDDPRVIQTPDTLEALHSWARHARAQFQGTVIGVTGSVGKTTTKEMLALVFADQAKTFASPSSYNNHWGLPLSMIRMPQNCEFGIFEMGMNHQGEISILTKIARPHIAQITTIEGVHLAHFRDVEHIADSKAEIFEGLENQGTVILNYDNPQYERLKARAEELSIHGKLITFGERKGADVRLLKTISTADSSTVKVALSHIEFAYNLKVPGRHMAFNSLGVLACAQAAGLNVLRAASKLADFNAYKGRGAREIITLPGGGKITLIDESYNASPPSVKAALKVLGKIEMPNGGTKHFVFGDMLEMGDAGPEAHRELLESVKAAGVKKLHTVGKLAELLLLEVSQDIQGAKSLTSKEISSQVVSALAPGDVVMLKGSLGNRLENVVKAIREMSTKPETEDPT